MAQKKFIGSWKHSLSTKKQRKYVFNAPLHIRAKLMGAHLSKELRQKYGKRTLTVRKDDKVKVVRGQFKGRTGKVMHVDMKKYSLFIEGVEVIKRDGTKAFFQIHPSKVVILELGLDDKKRLESLKRGKDNAHKAETKESAKTKKSGGRAKNG